MKSIRSDVLSSCVTVASRACNFDADLFFDDDDVLVVDGDGVKALGMINGVDFEVFRRLFWGLARSGVWICCWLVIVG